MDVQPEYDPHKYNSFPINAALQSYKFTTAIRAQINKMGELKEFLRPEHHELLKRIKHGSCLMAGPTRFTL